MPPTHAPPPQRHGRGFASGRLRAFSWVSTDAMQGLSAAASGTGCRPPARAHFRVKQVPDGAVPDAPKAHGAEIYLNDVDPV